MTNSIPFLRTHSHYGFLESLLAPETIVKNALKNNILTLGLTDHRFLSGAISFYEACKNVNIKPILGLEIDFTYANYQGLLTLFAKDREGWSNLCRLSTHMLVNEEMLNVNCLKSHRAGLLCLAGDPRGILHTLIFSSPQTQGLPDRLMDDLHSLFQEDLFVEIQRYPNGPVKGENFLLTLIKQHQVPIIGTQNIFYEHPEHHKTYQTLTAIRRNESIHGLSEGSLPPGMAHFPTLEDFILRYSSLPQALDNLREIEARCNLELPLGQTHFPTFPTPDGTSQADYLRSKAYQGAKSIYKNLTPLITQRLDYELEIISDLGYEPVFLIVEDVLNYAKDLDIPTSSRGSAASSLVAHCLNITSPDPIALNLYFERFLNPARKKPPDIDTDIASHRREEVIQYVFNTYGTDRVAMVGTINRYRPKSALGDVAKAYGLSPETIRQLSKKLPSSFRFQRDETESDPFRPLVKESSIPIIKDIAADAKAILDIPRHLSVHPGGIIISPFPMTDLVPLVHSSSLGINHAQFDLDGIEKLGLVKIDLLGIRGLTVLGEVAKRIKSWHRLQYNSSLDVLAQIPRDDTHTALTIEEAKTIGCFQIESPGMRATLREIKAKNVEDIMAALALYRPGPLRGGLRDAFVRRFRGEEPVTHIHESLHDLLDNTLGVILYQEQVLRIAHELGGLTIAQADILRRAMSHFDPGKVMDTLRLNFVAGARARKNVPKETAERIWDMMAAFAGYGFPKAHAASYAQLAWNSAWCKTHYPAEFMSAVLGFGGGYYSQRVYIMEARRMGLSIKAPHINYSNDRFRVIYPKGEPMLYMGLNQVRDLTLRTIGNIIEKRPFSSLEDFIIRCDPHRKEAVNLLMCGALEGLTGIRQGIARLEHQRPPGQMQLFTPTDDSDDLDLEARILAQEEILGVSLSISPLEQFADQIQSMGAVSTLEAQTLVGEKVRVAGMRQTWRRFRNRNNQMMCYLNIEDLEGSLQVMINSRLYGRTYKILSESGPFMVEGVIEYDVDRNRTRMIAETIFLFGSH
jgi:DNA-directed DNA polymerase III PolC